MLYIYIKCSLYRENKMISGERIYLLASLVAMITVEAVVNEKGNQNPTKNSNSPTSRSHTINRDYLDGFDDGYNEHDGAGLSAHASSAYHHDTFDGFDGGRHYGHHFEDSHLHHHHLHHVHKYHDDGSYRKALAIKGLLVPLAGVALLGAAAAFISNPILLQLGVISGTPLGRKRRALQWNTMGRKKRNTNGQYEISLNEIRLLENFMAQIPNVEIQAQEKSLMANVMSCAGIAGDQFCLERLACELYSSERIFKPAEADVLAILVNQILGNDFVADQTKKKISKAIEKGRENSRCHQFYKCEPLETIEKSLEEA